MPQLVGQPCIRCGQSIVSPFAGEWCAGCGKAVHFACRVADAELDSAGHCSRCGGDPSLVAPVEVREEWPGVAVPDDQPFSAIRVPDLRRRRPARQKALIGLGLLALAGAVLGLCWYGYGWFERNQIERLVRQGFEQQLRLDVRSIRLEQTQEHVYSGTITTTAGEDWDVTARLTWPNGRKQVRWEAQPPLERAERELRKDMEAKLNKRVRSLELVRQPDGRLSGKAELTSGEQYDIHEPEDRSSRVLMYEWNRATVEKWVRQSLRDEHNDEFASLSLDRKGATNYTGRGVGKAGLEYSVSTVPVAQGAEGAGQARLKIELLPSSYPRWVRQGMERQMKVKVTRITLTPHPAGYHTGQATIDTGEVYEVRAGRPPAWRNGPRDGVPTWNVVLSPQSYPARIKRDLEQTYPYKVKSVELKPRRDGKQEGLAHLEGGGSFRIWIDRKKRSGEEGANPWPDLPEEVSWRVAVPK